MVMRVDTFLKVNNSFFYMNATMNEFHEDDGYPRIPHSYPNEVFQIDLMYELFLEMGVSSFMKQRAKNNRKED